MASIGKSKYGKCKYKTGHFAGMDNASTENAWMKYGKHISIGPTCKC